MSGHKPTGQRNVFYVDGEADTAQTVTAHIETQRSVNMCILYSYCLCVAEH